MLPVATKVDGDTLSAEEYSKGLNDELQNFVKSSQQTLTGADLFQTAKAVADYAAAGDYYTDLGSANNYVLSVVGVDKQSPHQYIDGMRVRFKASNSNTGASTVNINGLGDININDENNIPLNKGAIVQGNEYTLIYNSGLSLFNLKSALSRSNVISFETIDDLKNGISLNESVDFLELALINSLVMVKFNNNNSRRGGDHYRINTLDQERIDRSDPSYLPDGFTDHFVGGGSVFVAILIQKNSFGDNVGVTSPIDTSAQSGEIDALAKLNERITYDVIGTNTLPVNIDFNSNSYNDLSAVKIICNNLQDYQVIGSQNKSDVSILNAHIESTTTSGINDAKAGVFVSSTDNNSIKNLRLSNSFINDCSWGALYRKEEGTGDLIGAVFNGNIVQSNSAGSKNDGIHVAGRYKSVSMTGNAIHNRGDAALAATMSLSHAGYGVTVTGNSATDCLVGVDFSGTQYGVEVGNVCYNTFAHTDSNPSFRGINSEDISAKFLVFGPGIALSNTSASGEVDGKIDVGGDVAEGIITGKITQKLFIDAKNVSIIGNHFIDNASIRIGNNSDNTYIINNTFMGAFDIILPPNPALGGFVKISKPNYNRLIPANFLPNYVNWVRLQGEQFADAETENIDLSKVTGFSTASTTYVDVPDSIFSLQFPHVAVDIRAVTSNSVGPTRLAITDLANTVLLEFRSDTGTDVEMAHNFPLSSGNPSLPKLSAGLYKVRARVESGSATFKMATLRLWG